MTDPLTAGAIATLIFTTAVGKLTEALTEDTRKHLAQKLQTLKQLIGNTFEGKAKSALVQADNGDEQAIATVSSYLGVAMNEDDDFAHQVRMLAQAIQQMISLEQGQGQTIQNVFDGKGTQVNNPAGTTVTGDGNTIHIGN